MHSQIEIRILGKSRIRIAGVNSDRHLAGSVFRRRIGQFQQRRTDVLHRQKRRFAHKFHPVFSDQYATEQRPVLTEPQTAQRQNRTVCSSVNHTVCRFPVRKILITAALILLPPISADLFSSHIKRRRSVRISFRIDGISEQFRLIGSDIELHGTRYPQGFGSLITAGFDAPAGRIGTADTFDGLLDGVILGQRYHSVRMIIGGKINLSASFFHGIVTEDRDAVQINIITCRNFRSLFVSQMAPAGAAGAPSVE